VRSTGLGDPEATERLRRLLRVADVALAHLSPEALLDELLIRVREILEVDTAAVLLLDERTDELVARAAKGIEEEVEQGVRIPVGRGFAGLVAAERRPVVIEQVDDRNVLNPILREKGIRSLLGVPLLVQGRVLGVIHVGSLTGREFGDHDVELLQLVAERAALALHVRLYEHERMVAETLQRTFLPEALPDVPGLRLASRYLPATGPAGIGGDWYDAFVLPSGGMALAMGDVAGHGLRAASVMGRVRNALRAYSIEGDRPADAVARLGRLVRLFDIDDIVTLLFGVIDAGLTEFRFVSAGHPPPLVITSTGQRFAENGRAEPPLGTGRFHPFREGVVPLGPGTSLLLFTDGLVEHRGESLSVGLERLRSVSSSVAFAGDLDDAVSTVLSGMLAGHEPADDIAILLVHRGDAAVTMDVRVAAEPTELATLRRALRRWLADRDVPASVADDVVTAAGEACANSVEHAYGPAGGWVRLTGSCDDEMVEVVVRDGGRWRDRPSARGRGLRLITAVTDSVEIDRSASGTTVTLRRRLEPR
jgi:serine phosphatase RsbU (regulator of sigma subunit)/anti-sigma regulatory factor (Ser/Thr protein kinase)